LLILNKELTKQLDTIKSILFKKKITIDIVTNNNNSKSNIFAKKIYFKNKNI